MSHELCTLGETNRSKYFSRLDVAAKNGFQNEPSIQMWYDSAMKKISKIENVFLIIFFIYYSAYFFKLIILLNLPRIIIYSLFSKIVSRKMLYN